MSSPTPAFCSNLLPQESWAELAPALAAFAGHVRQLSGLPRIGIDLRLGSAAIRELRPEAARAWAQALAGDGVLVTSLNIFPLSPFQTPVVKDQAYAPDWGTDERREMSIRAIALADAFSDPSLPFCSMSTVPGSYRPWAGQAASDHAIRANLAAWAAAAWQHRQAGGRRVLLAIEPEPCCTWGSGAELAANWAAQRQPFLQLLSDLLGDDEAAEQALAEHFCVCWDCCHASVLFEDQAATIAALAGVGLPPLKVQYSAAPGTRTQPDQAQVQALLDLSEPRFCHQVGIHHGDTIEVLSDLDHLAKLAADWAASGAYPQAIRTHFHIPVHRPADSQLLASTVAESDQGLAAALAHGAGHCSVETYTWSLRAAQGEDPAAGTAAELRHLAARLAGEHH